jgi:SAM-dependent methyltransferase
MSLSNLVPSRPERQSDAIYYEHGLSLPLATRVTLAARQDIFQQFMRVMQPTASMRILDFGVSETVREEANFFEQAYPWPERLTCLGIGDGTEIRASYPAVNYVSSAPGARLPFEDGSFDIAVSNAVLEHVGSDENRKFVIRELARVAKRLFLSVPNRWFPVEHHTGFPFLHYAPNIFRRTLRNTSYEYWAEPANLSFLGRAEITRFWPLEIRPQISFGGIGAGIWSSNILMWT